jgi:DNA primase
VRSVDRVTLCLDQDRPGREAAERAFCIAAKEGLQVEGIVLADKDPADAVLTSADELKELLVHGAKPFIDVVLESIKAADISSPIVRHAALERLMPLLNAVTSSTERTFMIRSIAEAIGTTEISLLDDLRMFEQKQISPKKQIVQSSQSMDLFSAVELALGLFMLYPQNIALLSELIAPETGFASVLHLALRKNQEASAPCTLEALDLDAETRHRAGILLLYCEENDFHQWNESASVREIRSNCMYANREMILQKQRDITKKLVEARKTGNAEEEKILSTQYVEVLKLSKITMV